MKQKNSLNITTMFVYIGSNDEEKQHEIETKIYIHFFHIIPPTHHGYVKRKKSI